MSLILQSHAKHSQPSTQYHKSIEESLLTCLEHISGNKLIEFECKFLPLEVKNGYPVNVSIQNKAGQTLLMLATIQGCHRLVKVSMKCGFTLTLHSAVVATGSKCKYTRCQRIHCTPFCSVVRISSNTIRIHCFDSCTGYGEVVALRIGTHNKHAFTNTW